MQKWGVPDEYLYRRAYEDIKKSKKPFLKIIYNISSHEPFDLPHNYEKIKGSDEVSRYCNAICYADSCLGEFFDSVKTTSQWKNTVVIITSDHTNIKALPHTSIENPKSFNIPLLWFGGAIDTSFVCNNYCMQTDLSTSILQQFGFGKRPYKFSKNVFGKRQYALYHCDQVWGFANPDIKVSYILATGKKKFYKGENYAKRDSLIHFAEGFTQYLHNDFQKK